MSIEAIEDALKITLEDHRLSRGEKRALTKVVEKIAGDEHQLAQARHFAFEIARAELVGPEALSVIEWLEDVMKVLLPKSDSSTENSEAFFSPNDNCVNKIVRMFETARKCVDVCVFTITDDRITDAMVAAHRRKVAIRVISDNDKSLDRGSDIEELARRGIAMRLDQTEFHMHHKYALFDNRTLLTGSYNWTRSASKYNEENFLLTNDAALVKSFSRAFEELWSQLG